MSGKIIIPPGENMLNGIIQLKKMTTSKEKLRDKKMIGKNDKSQ